MDSLLALYREYKEWIELIKDLVFFVGAYTFFHGTYLLIKYLRNKRFEAVSSSIDSNLKFREKLEPLLREFVFDKAPNTKDIAIRFVHWKNYPWNLSDDAYKFYLHIRYLDQTPHYGWLDNTGVNFEQHPWSFGNSTYVDNNGIFFFAPKGLNTARFQEFTDTVLVLKMPFKNIINYDFRQLIEYEPVFYTRYYYNNWNKLYDDKVVLRNKEGCGHLIMDLSQKNMMRKYSRLRYGFILTKLWLLKMWRNKKAT